MKKPHKRNVVVLVKPEERYEAEQIFGRKSVVVDGGSLAGREIVCVMRTYPANRSAWEQCELEPRLTPISQHAVKPLSELRYWWFDNWHNYGKAKR